MSIPNPKQLENAHLFLTYVNEIDFDAISALLSPNFEHRYFPGTIVPPDGKEYRGKEEYVEVLKHNFLNVFDKVTYGPPLAAVHGVDAVVFHLKSDGASKSGRKYDNEYMITFRFEGELIVALDEFVDSKYSKDYFAALRAEAGELTPMQIGGVGKLERRFTMYGDGAIFTPSGRTEIPGIPSTNSHPWKKLQVQIFQATEPLMPATPTDLITILVAYLSPRSVNLNDQATPEPLVQRHHILANSPCATHSYGSDLHHLEIDEIIISLSLRYKLLLSIEMLTVDRAFLPLTYLFCYERDICVKAESDGKEKDL
ncbi:hypothetical protein DFH07DRAFT_770849 [Mycena maculata]|uniref:SnoaL-like domain-containing protein n=1 Tax=Mycena maculata TaxID=230809 RepID=A0AAD7NJC6_9AGAR|nr:hypothetical protein DFH07DRAFT_770849 [Mycena maculata]